MNGPSHDAIARRAYAKWEQEGRPVGREHVHWQAAEAELARGEFHAANEADEASSEADPLNLQSGPAVSDLDRALPVEERRRVRARRNPTPEPTAAATPYFVVTLDRARVRIYRSSENSGSSRLQLQLEQSYDLPVGHDAYFASESDQAGRFPGGVRGAPADVATHAGGSIDERLPMQREHERRITALLASLVEQFLLQHPAARWDFVAPAPVHHAVWERLSSDARDRAGAKVTKDLVHLPVKELADRIADARRTGA